MKNATENHKKVARKVISHSKSAYSVDMRRRIASIILLAALLPVLSACRQEDYTEHISEVRRDIFCAQTEDFTLTLSCTSREYPYADDGIACPMSDLIEVTLTPAVSPAGDVLVYAADESWGGEASFSAVHGDYRFSQGVETFPAGSVDLRIAWGERTYEVAATSVRTEETLSPEAALAVLTESESETLTRMRKEGVFCGEFRVRLLRREQNYYYVAVTDGEEQIALLIDAQTGEILARRAT